MLQMIALKDFQSFNLACLFCPAFDEVQICQSSVIRPAFNNYHILFLNQYVL